MRALLSGLTIVALLSASGAADAAPGDVIASFPWSEDSASGLGWDGETLWVANLQTATGGGKNRVTQHDPTTMQEMGGFDMPGTDIFHGLAFDEDGRIWTDNFNKSVILLTDIVQLDRDGNTMKVLSGQGTLYGVAYDREERRIFQVDNHSVEDGGNSMPSDLFIVDPDDGSVLSGPVPLQFSGARGVAWDGEALWVASNVTDSLYRVDIDSGATLAQLSAPGGGGTEGLTFDGNCLWVSDTQSDTIFVVDPGHLEPTTCTGLPPKPNSSGGGGGEGGGGPGGDDGGSSPGSQDDDSEPPAGVDDEPSASPGDDDEGASNDAGGCALSSTRGWGDSSPTPWSSAALVVGLGLLLRRRSRWRTPAAYLTYGAP